MVCLSLRSVFPVQPLISVPSRQRRCTSRRRPTRDRGQTTGCSISGYHRRQAQPGDRPLSTSTDEAGASRSSTLYTCLCAASSDIRLFTQTDFRPRAKARIPDSPVSERFSKRIRSIWLQSNFTITSISIFRCPDICVQYAAIVDRSTSRPGKGVLSSHGHTCGRPHKRGAIKQCCTRFCILFSATFTRIFATRERGVRLRSETGPCVCCTYVSPICRDALSPSKASAIPPLEQSKQANASGQKDFFWQYRRTSQAPGLKCDGDIYRPICAYGNETYHRHGASPPNRLTKQVEV